MKIKNSKENIDLIEEYDRLKTKVLKYIIYKKRTEKEVLQKFSSTIDEEILDDIVEELKEIGYIDDTDYVERAVQEFIALKNMSIKEIKYKLFAKGLNNDIIEEYISNHIEELMDYEVQSVKNIFYKKQMTMKIEEIKQFLLKKGYMMENIKDAFSEVQ